MEYAIVKLRRFSLLSHDISLFDGCEFPVREMKEIEKKYHKLRWL
jgi:hypothetical protein